MSMPVSYLKNHQQFKDSIDPDSTFPTCIQKMISHRQETVREPNSENCLHLIFDESPCEKVVIVPDTNCIHLQS